MNLDVVQDWTAFAARHNFRVKAVAQHFNVNRRTVQRAFHARFDRTSPRAWLAGLRDALAVELLRAGSLSNKEIAARLCYSELSAFTRAFTRRHGMSPRKFRQSLRPPARPGAVPFGQVRRLAAPVAKAEPPVRSSGCRA